MYKYILKRLALMIPVIIGVSFIIFSIMSFMPGNPARLILGEKQRRKRSNRLMKNWA